MIEVVLRRPGRMIRMRVIEAQEVATGLGRALLRLPIVGWANQESPTGAFLGRIGQGIGRSHRPIATDKRPATFIGIRLHPVCADGRVHSRPQRQRHQAPVPVVDDISPQKRSDRYFSPPSGKIATITASEASRATRSAPASAPPLEMPTNN